MLKTHNATEVDSSLLGQTVTLAGWVDRRRDHGGLIFIDLRDVSGIIQLAINPEIDAGVHEVLIGDANDLIQNTTNNITGTLITQ